MSARILYALTDDKEGGGGGGRGAHKHIGCMNGIFQLFDRGHFLPGGRCLAGSGRKRLTAGQNENYGAEEDTMSVKSMVSKAVAAKERHRLSTDSSRSSASSSCNSRSFSSIEDHKLAKMELVNLTENRADLPRLQQYNLKDSGKNPFPKSSAMTYVASPRPVLPLKVPRERNSTASESLRDLRSLGGPRNFVDRPRFSYDGWESRDEIKFRETKLKEQPRHSVDSKRSSLSSLSLKVHEQQEDPGSHKWQSSIVAKLMGLEAIASNVQTSSKPQMGHGRNSPVDALDPFSVSSRTANDDKHKLNADLVVRLKPNVVRVQDKVSVTSKESPLQSPTLLVYGELEKRPEQIKFKRSGKDLGALKQILEAMQRSEQPGVGRRKIHRAFTKRSNTGDSEFMAKFAHRGNTKSSGPMTSHEVGRPICLDNLKGPLTKATIGFDREHIPLSRNGILGLSKIQVSTKIRSNSSDQQRTGDLTPRASPRQTHYTSRSGISNLRAEDRQQIAEANIPGRNFGDSSPRPRQKKLEPMYSRNRSNHPGRQPKDSQSLRRTPKSKVCSDLSGGNSRKLTERSNRISTQSDNEGSLTSQDEDTEVTSSYVSQSQQTTKKVLSRSKVDEERPSKFGTTLAEQTSPVSVLDSSYLEDESPSPVQMTSEAFRGDKAPSFHRKGRGLRASSDLFPNEKHCKAPNKPQTESTHSEHSYILQTLSSSGVHGNPDTSNLMLIQLLASGAVMTNLFSTPGHDKLSSNLLPGEDLSEGCMDQSQSKRGERIQRKLLFDIIDEILVQQLTADNHGNRFLPGSLVVKKTGQEQLLKGLRSEIAHLQADNSNSKCDINNDEKEDLIQTISRRDLVHESQSWKGWYDDSSIVLDIERLIFKDLVTEVVAGDAPGLRNSLTGYSRQMALK